MNARFESPVHYDNLNLSEAILPSVVILFQSISGSGQQIARFERDSLLNTSQSSLASSCADAVVDDLDAVVRASQTGASDERRWVLASLEQRTIWCAARRGGMWGLLLLRFLALPIERGRASLRGSVCVRVCVCILCVSEAQ